MTERSLSTIHPKWCCSASANVWPDYRNSSICSAEDASLSGRDFISSLLLCGTHWDLTENIRLSDTNVLPHTLLIYFTVNIVLLQLLSRKTSKTLKQLSLLKWKSAQRPNSQCSCGVFLLRYSVHFAAVKAWITYVQTQVNARAPLSHHYIPTLCTRCSICTHMCPSVYLCVGVNEYKQVLCTCGV